MLESGCMLEHPAAAKFRAHVMDGDWCKVSQSDTCAHTHTNAVHSLCCYFKPMRSNYMADMWDRVKEAKTAFAGN